MDIQIIVRFISYFDPAPEVRGFDDLFGSYVLNRDDFKIAKLYKKIRALNLSLRWNQILCDSLLFGRLRLLLSTTKKPNGHA